LSNIILGGITLPKLVDMPKLDYEPVILFSEPSITGRLHKVFQRFVCKQFGDIINSVKFNRKFSFKIINLTYEEWQAIDAIDGTNCTLRFERDAYIEEYLGNLDCNFFKFDKNNYFDAVNIEFTITEEVYVQSIMYFARTITNPITSNLNLMFLGSKYIEITGWAYNQHGYPQFPGYHEVSVTIHNLDSGDETYPEKIKVQFDYPSNPNSMWLDIITGTFPNFTYTHFPAVSVPSSGIHNSKIIECYPNDIYESSTIIWVGGWTPPP